MPNQRKVMHVRLIVRMAGLAAAAAQLPTDESLQLGFGFVNQLKLKLISLCSRKVMHVRMIVRKAGLAAAVAQSAHR